jgi:hypothetical protein
MDINSCDAFKHIEYLPKFSKAAENIGVGIYPIALAVDEIEEPFHVIIQGHTEQIYVVIYLTHPQFKGIWQIFGQPLLDRGWQFIPVALSGPVIISRAYNRSNPKIIAASICSILDIFEPSLIAHGDEATPEWLSK